MELSKWPETQGEYWAAIEELGGFIWSMNHELMHGRITESEGANQGIKDARAIQEKLVSEITVKFGVVTPKDGPRLGIGEEMPQAPEGQIWYWDWYHKMKKEVYAEAYAKIICSACALSEGLDTYIRLGKIPCGAFNGMLYRLNQPYECAMLEYWKRNRLLMEILKKGGEEAVQVFEEKEKELKILNC